MNFSLKNRIFISFFFSLLIVLVSGLNVFFYLNKLNKEIEKITVSVNKEDALTDALRISIMNIIDVQRKISAKIATEDDLEGMIGSIEGFESQLGKLSSFYRGGGEIEKNISEIIGFVKSFRTLIERTEDSGKERWRIPDESRKTIADNTGQITSLYTSFLTKKLKKSEKAKKRMMAIIKKTKDNMLLTLILTGLGALLLSMIIPAKIALPFRKINDAIRELQECNFDVSIYYNENDEIGELASEINKMIRNLKRFEELRSDKITLEQRKFDALANMLKKNVMVANGDGKVIYLNNTLYSMLDLRSDDVIGKVPDETVLPESIRTIFELAIKRRTKIENEPVDFELKATGDQEDEPSEKKYQGFANIIPIRGKESSLDYYIMIISKQVFV